MTDGPDGLVHVSRWYTQGSVTECSPQNREAFVLNQDVVAGNAAVTCFRCLTIPRDVVPRAAYRRTGRWFSRRL